MDLSRILVLADRQDPRQFAVRAAVRLARGNGASLRVVACVYDPLVEQPHALSPTAARKLETTLVADKQRWLDDALARIPLDGVTVTSTTLWAKDVAAQVCAEAVRAGSGLIVKAGHRTETLLYTPSDWQLLRESPVPVLIVGSKFAAGGSCVVAALDLGAVDQRQRKLNTRVLAAACRAAERLDATIHVIHALSVSTLVRDLDLVDLAALERKAGPRIAPYIEELSAQFGVPREQFKIKAGPPERVIDGFATKHKAGLIVLGTIGRTGLRGRLIGNTAEKVLHRTRTSVLAVKPAR
jgi:universal stress protein E